MSSTYNPLIQKIYKSRIVILEILKRRGYKVEDYDNFEKLTNGGTEPSFDELRRYLNTNILPKLKIHY